VPVWGLAVADTAGADDAREADVDDADVVNAVPRLDVEADPEAEEEHRRGGEEPRRPDRAQESGSATEADPEAAREQIARTG
jgi:hypothetical protein